MEAASTVRSDPSCMLHEATYWYTLPHCTPDVLRCFVCALKDTPYPPTPPPSIRRTLRTAHIEFIESQLYVGLMMWGLVHRYGLLAPAPHSWL